MAYREMNNNEEREKKVDKVVKGKVTMKKKPWWSKLINDDIDSIGTYIKDEVLIPRIKSTIVDTINGSTERIFGVGRTSSAPSNTFYKTANTNYSKMHKREEAQPKKTSKFEFKDIIFESRSDAEDVKDQIEAIIDTYGTASVADLYDLLGVNQDQVDFTDNYYGWYIGDVKGFSVHYVNNGYRLNIPRPTVIK